LYFLLFSDQFNRSLRITEIPAEISFSGIAEFSLFANVKKKTGVDLRLKSKNHVVKFHFRYFFMNFHHNNKSVCQNDSLLDLMLEIHC